MTQKSLIAVSAILGLILMIVWMAGGFSDRIEPGLTEPKAIDNSKAFTLTSSSIETLEPVPATIQAKQTTFVSSRIIARIERINVRAGDTVSTGQLLIELENSDLKSRVAQSRTQIDAIQARLTEAKKSLDRALELRKQNVIPVADLDRARSNYDALVADNATAEQALFEAETALDFSQIRSPINGRLVDRFAEPGDTAQPGTKLLTIYNPLTLRVEANVREKLALSLTIGQRLTANLPSLEQQREVEIEELVPAGDSGARSFLVKARLKSTQGLLPGIYARLMVPAGEQSLLLIPADIIGEVGQLNVVWVVDGNKINRRFVRLGREYPDNLIEVISGLREGDRILPKP